MILRLLIAFLTGVFFSFAASSVALQGQVGSTTQSPYRLKVLVNEVSLTFHASGPQGEPLTKLTVGDIKLSDRGKPQNRIMMLQSLENLPIRVGFLFDISASMQKNIDFNSSVVQQYASRLLRKGFDQAFVMQFDTYPLLIRGWTEDDAAIATASTVVGPRPNRIDPLTAIFDSLYRTCRDQWNGKEFETTGNFILLFSDGEDDASHAYLREAVDMCQRRHVAIYIFETEPTSHFSDGPKTLSDLAAQTGGRVFRHPRANEIQDDLKVIEAEQRNQYRLVYKPNDFVADDSFHPVRLRCLIHGSHIVMRSGYYALVRR